MFKGCKMSRIKDCAGGLQLSQGTAGGTVVKAYSSRCSSCWQELQSVSVAPVCFVVSILPSPVLLLLDFSYLLKLYEHHLPCQMFLHDYPPSTSHLKRVLAVFGEQLTKLFVCL